MRTSPGGSGAASAVEGFLQCFHLVIPEFRQLLGLMMLQISIQNLQDERGLGAPMQRCEILGEPVPLDLVHCLLVGQLRSRYPDVPIGPADRISIDLPDIPKLALVRCRILRTADQSVLAGPTR